MFSTKIGIRPRGLPFWRQLLPSSSNLFLLAFLLVSLLMNGGLTPYRRGFFCNDTTIQYPIKSDTVSFKVLLIVALLIPSFVIKLLERKLFQLMHDYPTPPRAKSVLDSTDQETEEDKLMDTPTERIKRLVINEDDSDLEACDDQKTPSNLSDISQTYYGDISEAPRVVARSVDCQEDHPTILDARFRTRLRQSAVKKTFSDVQVFFFGFTTTSFLSGIGKMACGRLRPHFLQQCKPNVDCTLPQNAFKYIENFKCTNEALKSRDYSYITTSWPSGHAAIIFYSMLYLILYLDSVIPIIARFRVTSRSQRARYNPLLVDSIYVLMIGLAMYISLTRVSDYHHHPTDVISGTIIGTIVALVLAHKVYKPLLKIPSR